MAASDRERTEMDTHRTPGLGVEERPARHCLPLARSASGRGLGCWQGLQPQGLCTHWAGSGSVPSLRHYASESLEETLMYLLIVALLAFFVALPASAQVAVDIGINLPAPPALEVVAEAPSVQYVPTADANLFFYGGQYWAYTNNGWYYSGGYNGPWIGVGPEFVPQPLLIVPVTYYRRPPPAWRGWQGGRPPGGATVTDVRGRESARSSSPVAKPVRKRSVRQPGRSHVRERQARPAPQHAEVKEQPRPSASAR